MAKRALAFAAVFLICLISRVAHAQQEYGQIMSGCVQEFYDPQSYNWLSYRNTCNEDIYVSWVSRSPGLNGASDIGPGRKANTGWSAREIAAKGGIVAYACAKGYLPVDPEDNPITRQVPQYRCKYQGD